MKKRMSKVLKAYYAGQQARLSGKPSNMPPKLSKIEQKAWRNGYNEGA
jgi:ribosome modulation factor